MQRAIQYVLRQLARIWSWTKPYLTWKMLPIALSIWVLTNGMWYALAVIPQTPLWLRSIALAYIVFIYSPIGLEKIVIIVFAPIIYRWIYKEEFKGEMKDDKGRNIESQSRRK